MSAIFKFIGEWTAANPGLEAGLEAALWDRFGCEQTVLVVDMEGFTTSTRERGIVHYLRLIQRMQATAEPLLIRHGGRLVRFEADNLFAVFPEPNQAVAMMQALINQLEDDNRRRARSDQVHVSAGIDHGKILLAEADFFGDAVNMASKLGEDLARSQEVLVTAAVREMTARPGMEFTEFGSHEFAGTPEPVFLLALAPGT